MNDYELLKTLLADHYKLRMDYIDYRNGHLRGHLDCADGAIVNHRLSLCQGHALALKAIADNFTACGRPEVAEMLMAQVNLPYPK